TLEAFLDPDNNNNNSVNNLTSNQALQHAVNWSSENNPYLYLFANFLLQHNQNGSFPRAQQVQTNNEVPSESRSTIDSDSSLNTYTVRS
ncbi:10078_t:CDS:2, partial [Gigaspora rosea]